MKSSRVSIARTLALPFEKLRAQCPVCFFPGRFGSSSVSVSLMLFGSEGFKGTAHSTVSAIVGEASTIHKNATESKCSLPKSNILKESRGGRKNVSKYTVSGISSSGPYDLNMAKIINRLSPRNAGRNIVLSPREAVGMKFYHQVTKYYHHVILKIDFKEL